MRDNSDTMVVHYRERIATGVKRNHNFLDMDGGLIGDSTLVQKGLTVLGSIFIYVTS